MATRPTLETIAADGYGAVLALDTYVRSSVQPTLLELVNVRVSMVNGCVFCIDMHSSAALAAGEDPRRLLALAAWEEAPLLYTEHERSALALADSVTTLDGGIDDDVWDSAVETLGAPMTGELLIAIANINVLNRVAISTRRQPPALAA